MSFGPRVVSHFAKGVAGPSSTKNSVQRPVGNDIDRTKMCIESRQCIVHSQSFLADLSTCFGYRMLDMSGL